MERPTTSRLDRTAKEAGRWGKAGNARPFDRNGRLPALLRPSSLSAEQLQTLRAWLAGTAVLRPEQARLMLEQAVDRRQFVDEPVLHWRAVKALVAGASNWAEMGYQLVLD